MGQGRVGQGRGSLLDSDSYQAVVRDGIHADPTKQGKCILSLHWHGVHSRSGGV